MNWMKKAVITTSWVALSITATVSGMANAETSVIVNPANSVELTADDVAKLYLGKTNKFPDSSTATAYDQKEGSALRQQFLDAVVGKSESQMKSHWSRLIFTGKGVPPKALDSDAAVVAEVASNPEAIGFVDSGAVTGDVRVAFTF